MSQSLLDKIENASNRKPDQTAENSRRPPMGFEHGETLINRRCAFQLNEKIPHLEVCISIEN